YEERPGQGQPILRGGKGGAMLMVAEAGDGRIVNLASGYGNSSFCILPRPLGSEHVLHHFDYWEYEYAMLANAMLWAAHREPGATVRVSGPTQFTRGTSGSEITVTAEAAAPVEGTIALNLSRIDGANVYEETRNVSLAPDAPNELRLALPKGLSAGDHVLDAVLRDGEGRVVDWHSERILVDGEVAIEEVALGGKSYHKRGDMLQIGVTVANQGSAREGTLRFTIVDTFDRVVHYETLPAALPEGSATFEHSIRLDPDRFLTEVHRLNVMVFDDVGLAATSSRRLYTPLAPEEKHRSWWAAGTGGGTHLHPHIYRHMAKAIRAMNIKGIQTNGGYQPHQAELILDNNFWVTPENIVSLGPWNQRFPDGVRDPCISDPDFLNNDIQGRAFEFAESFRTFQPLGYATAEETSLSASRPDGTVCLSPHCRRAFIAWLEGIYPDLESLNEQWDTDFATWDDVEGLRWEDGAADLDNPSRWIDFRMFMEQVVATMQRRFNQGIHQADPDAYVGFNCAPYGVNPFHGFNRPLLGKITNFTIEYQPSWLEDRGVSTSLELLADSSPHMQISYWLGYNYMDQDPDRYWFKTWWMAFRQLQGPTFYTLSNDASTIAHYSYMKLHPTLAFNQFSTLGKEVTGSLASGIGKLLQGCERQVDIGIYFSRASMMRNYVEQQQHPAEFSVWDVRKHLREEHHDYRRVVRHQLESGHADRFGLLMLTDAVALGDDEWALLEQYVSRGGTVMAFARTGVADGHGKLRTDHAWAAKLLGIRYGDAEAQWKAESIQGFEAAAGMGQVMTPGAVQVDGGVVSATFSDGAPAVVIRRIGQGTAVFCNFSARLDDTAENRRLVSTLVGTSGDKRSFRVMGDDGITGGFQSFRFTQGPIELIGLLHTLSSSVKAGTPLSLESRTKAHTYNVLTGEYAGEASEVGFAAPERGHPELFARLAYAVDGVTVTCPDRAGAGESIPYSVAVETTDGTAGNHVLRIEVTNPEGQVIDVLTKNVIAPQGKYEGVIPFAWNDGPGDWTITARDVITGKTTSHAIAVKTVPGSLAKAPSPRSKGKM
ncbi:MAG: beta-galactosidase, partial [Chloroflexi bacterium]|nr:beta-galactosidase [Chloroflexota bacterium]